MDPTGLSKTCNSNRGKNCLSISVDFDPLKFNFEIKLKTSQIIIPIDDFPKLRDRILNSNKDQRRILRRELERWISKPGQIEVNDLRVIEMSHGLLIKGATGKDYLILSTCGCLRAYLLFAMSNLIGRFDDPDTKIFNLLQKVTK